MTAIYDNKIVTIIDYGAGNLRSVARAVSHAGYKPLITSDPTDIPEAWSLIVPGVGAAADTMHNLQAGSFIEPILNYTKSGRPFLGICMGMQALFDSSDEDGFQKCLGILEINDKTFSFTNKGKLLSNEVFREILYPEKM